MNNILINQEDKIFHKELDESLFKLSEDGVTVKKQKEAMESFKYYVKEKKENFLGYQANQHLNYSS